MLVLGRQLYERIYITGPCWVTVAHISPGKVRLGFDAAPEVRIYREEVLNRITANEHKETKDGNGG